MIRKSDARWIKDYGNGSEPILRSTPMHNKSPDPYLTLNTSDFYSDTPDKCPGEASWIRIFEILF